MSSHSSHLIRESLQQELGLQESREHELNQKRHSLGWNLEGEKNPFSSCTWNAERCYQSNFKCPEKKLLANNILLLSATLITNPGASVLCYWKWETVALESVLGF